MGHAVSRDCSSRVTPMQICCTGRHGLLSKRRTRALLHPPTPGSRLMDESHTLNEARVSLPLWPPHVYQSSYPSTPPSHAILRSGPVLMYPAWCTLAAVHHIPFSLHLIFLLCRPHSSICSHPSPQLIKGNTFGGTAFTSYGSFWMGWWVHEATEQRMMVDAKHVAAVPVVLLLRCIIAVPEQHVTTCGVCDQAYSQKCTLVDKGCLFAAQPGAHAAQNGNDGRLFASQENPILLKQSAALHFVLSERLPSDTDLSFPSMLPTNLPCPHPPHPGSFSSS